jgi:hypothetical protein
LQQGNENHCGHGQESNLHARQPSFVQIELSLEKESGQSISNLYLRKASYFWILAYGKQNFFTKKYGNNSQRYKEGNVDEATSV